MAKEHNPAWEGLGRHVQHLLHHRRGRRDPGRSVGFDPTDKGFYHGGDLKGVTQKLDYIKGLGTSASTSGGSEPGRAICHNAT